MCDIGISLWHHDCLIAHLREHLKCLIDNCHASLRWLYSCMSGFKALRSFFWAILRTWYQMHILTTHNFNFIILFPILFSSWIICRHIAWTALYRNLYQYLFTINCLALTWVLSIASETWSVTKQNSATIDYGTYTSYYWTGMSLRCILTQTNEQGRFRPHIFSQCHYSLRHRMLRSRHSVDQEVPQVVPTTECVGLQIPLTCISHYHRLHMYFCVSRTKLCNAPLDKI